MWDVVHELIIASRRHATSDGHAESGDIDSRVFGEDDYAFKIDIASLLHLEKAAAASSQSPDIAFIAAGGLLSFLRYAIETRVIPLTAAVLHDVEVLADIHVRGIRRRFSHAHVHVDAPP